MGSYSSIRKGCSRGKYAAGGRVAAQRTGGKTVINVISAPAPGAAPGVPAAPPVPPPAMPSPAAAGPAPGGMPPEAAAMALGQMQGKPGAPGMFKRGGRVSGGKTSKTTPSAKVAGLKPPHMTAGASGGKGRKQEIALEKKVPGKPGAIAK